MRVTVPYRDCTLVMDRECIMNKQKEVIDPVEPQREGGRTSPAPCRFAKMTYEGLDRLRPCRGRHLFRRQWVSRARRVLRGDPLAAQPWTAGRKSTPSSTRTSRKTSWRRSSGRSWRSTREHQRRRRRGRPHTVLDGVQTILEGVATGEEPTVAEALDIRARHALPEASPPRFFCRAPSRALYNLRGARGGDTITFFGSGFKRASKALRVPLQVQGRLHPAAGRRRECCYSTFCLSPRLFLISQTCIHI